MKRFTLLFASFSLLFAALACIGGVERPEPTSGDPQAILDQAQAAMAALESYHAVFIDPGAAEDAQGEYRSGVSYAAPDSFRFVTFFTGGEIGTRTILSETVVTGDTIYRRLCEDVDVGCEPWEEQPRGQVVFPGSPAILPQWPLVAMEMAGDLEFVGQDEVDGVALTHFRGSVNHIRAIFEGLRRSAAAGGITSLGTECTAVLTPIVMNETGEPVEAALGTPVESEGNCREQTFEESLENQEPGLSFYDENHTTIDVWVSPDDLLVHRAAVSIPPDQPGDVAVSFVVEYSLFGQVQIEAPR